MSMKTVVKSKIGFSICDCHVHVGQFRELYFSPKYVAGLIDKLSIKKALVLSMSGQLSFKKEIDELKALGDLCGDRIRMGLWVYPDMIEQGQCFDRYLKMDFKVLKIHGRFSKWIPMGRKIRKLFEIAKERKFTVMIHTGGDNHCDAGVYRRICRDNPEVNIILAHGKPIEQTLPILKECKNVFVDTSYIGLDAVLLLKDNDLLCKTIFGSDLPLDRYFFQGKSVTRKYLDNLRSISELVGKKVFSEISENNFYRLIEQ